MQMSTVDREAASRPPAQASVTLRRLALLALPLLALGALQLWPPVHLDASPLVSWAFPAATALLSLAAASAMLVALVAGLRVGSAASFFFAAGSGGLAATYAVEALAGPSGAASAPSGASSIGDALAGLLFVAGAVLAVLGTMRESVRRNGWSLLSEDEPENGEPDVHRTQPHGEAAGGTATTGEEDR
jgi:uncharacterized integral membrane protein